MTGFTMFPKIPHLFKDVVITEKIDGTNGGIRIEQLDLDGPFETDGSDGSIAIVGKEEPYYRVFAQSRNRDITPQNDNAGFAAWVHEHAERLVEVLGEGVHFGEWWGSGIQRGYGLEKGDKRFSLFNTGRWGHFADPEQAPDIPGLGVVPVLGKRVFCTDHIGEVAFDLSANGSVAAPGFMKPEGIVVYHSASNSLFKMPVDKNS